MNTIITFHPDRAGAFSKQIEESSRAVTRIQAISVPFVAYITEEFLNASEFPRVMHESNTFGTFTQRNAAQCQRVMQE